MMKTKGQVAIGDAVEVKVMERDDPLPLTAEPFQPDKRISFSARWVPATVSHVSPQYITITFADHERLSVGRYEPTWRYQ